MIQKFLLIFGIILCAVFMSGCPPVHYPVTIPEEDLLLFRGLDE